MQKQKQKIIPNPQDLKQELKDLVVSFAAAKQGSDEFWDVAASVVTKGGTHPARLGFGV